VVLRAHYRMPEAARLGGGRGQSPQARQSHCCGSPAGQSHPGPLRASDFQEDTGDSAASQVRARDRDPRLGDEKPVRFDNLVNGWASERRPTEKTLYSWRRVLGQLAAHLGHDDASRVRAEDLISWKAALVEAGLRAKTIRETKLAPVRAILQWGVNNGRLGANPAQPVTIDVKVKPGEAKRGFTDEEARIVLRAALKESDAVRRWVPWLCAYSGARLSEVCQLRAEDVVQVDGVW
jgi:integrase